MISDYRNRLLIYLILLTLVMLVVGYYVFAQRTPYKASMGFIDAYTSGSGATYYQVYQELVDCLEFYESGGNIDAVGLAGEIGILQFLPSTFKSYCVDRLDYRDDIKDPEIQRECASEIIHRGGIKNWTTRKFCRSESTSG